MIRKPVKDEDHPADEHYMDQLNEIQKKGKSWLVKHLKKEDPTFGFARFIIQKWPPFFFGSIHS